MERIKLAIERARQQAATLAAAAGPSSDMQLQPQVAPGPAAGGPMGWGAAVSEDVIPLDLAHLERHRVVTLDQANPYRREFDLLRTQVLQKMEEHGWRTVAVTSPSTQSGKTVVAINLALSIAHHPARTALLADFDLRRPQVAACLGLPQRPSLSEVLTGEAAVHEAVVHVGVPGFLVLPTHRPVAGAAEIMASDKVAKIIRQLRDNDPERIIVFDLPPVTAVDDVIAVLPRVDCVLLVVGSGSSTRRELEESQRHLARSNLLGVVVNKATDNINRGEYY